MHSIVTAVDIAALPETVWAVLMDWSVYPTWNPFIREIAGKAKVGGEIKVLIALPIGSVRITATVTRLRPGAEFAWHSGLPLAGLFDRDHVIEIEPRSSGCRLTQTQTFAGALARSISLAADGLARSGSERMNAALKARVEGEAGLA